VCAADHTGQCRRGLPGESHNNSPGCGGGEQQQPTPRWEKPRGVFRVATLAKQRQAGSQFVHISEYLHERWHPPADQLGSASKVTVTPSWAERSSGCLKVCHADTLKTKEDGGTQSALPLPPFFGSIMPEPDLSCLYPPAQPLGLRYIVSRSIAAIL